MQPLLTPDNYVGRIVDLFEEAKRSIYLPLAYITYNDDPANAQFTAMLETLAELSYRPHLDVEIIVGNADIPAGMVRMSWRDYFG